MIGILELKFEAVVPTATKAVVSLFLVIHCCCNPSINVTKMAIFVGFLG